MATVAVLLTGSAALADPNDFSIYKLGNPAVSPEANANFRIFARELGAALTSVNLSPPETLGHAAFAIHAELSVVQLRTTGTGAFNLPTQGPAPSTLLIPSAHIRKGLPFSFEIGARTGWIEKSRMGVGTIEVKWAMNEGFAFLPDLGVRGYGTRLFNSRDFDLTAAGLDLGLGKQFAIGGMVTLYPYVGWNLVWVSATSNNVDFNPGRSQESSIRTSTAQLQDTTVFEDVGLGANQHNRFYGGLRFIGGVVQIGAEISYSSLGKFRDVTTATDKTMPEVLTINSTLGLDF
ncbi:MAG: hypothetical protein ACYC8T_33775 [Myxococcaceae bacterium]